MSAFERQESPDAALIRQCLSQMDLVLNRWHQRIVGRQEQATVDDVVGLRVALQSVKRSLPEALELTYHTAARVLADTEFLLLQRDGGYDVTSLWRQVIQRGLHALEHIERMQGFVARKG